MKRARQAGVEVTGEGKGDKEDGWQEVRSMMTFASVRRAQL